MKFKISLFAFAIILLPALLHAESFAQVEMYFLEGRYGMAVQQAEKLISLKAFQKEDIFYILGLSRLKMNKFSEARESFNAVLSKFPFGKKAMNAQIGIGDAYFLEGDMNTALKKYEEVLDKYPEDKNAPSIYYRMGNCYKNMGFTDKADKFFAKVRSSGPLSFEARMSPQTVAVKSVPEKRRIEIPKAPVHEDYFYIQAGVFKNKKNAERFTHKLYREGYDSYLSIETDLYRVKVGKYRTKNEAEAAAAKLKHSGYKTKICSGELCE